MGLFAVNPTVWLVLGALFLAALAWRVARQKVATLRAWLGIRWSEKRAQKGP